jgi:hypothetical protein
MIAGRRRKQDVPGSEKTPTRGYGRTERWMAKGSYGKGILMIPPLRKNGLLPPGIHRATLDEVFRAFPARNQQRQILNDSLQQVVVALQTLDPPIMISIDGSYITSKAEPNDVDLLIVSAQHATQDILEYLDRVCPVEVVLLSIYVESSIPNMVFDFFTTTRTGQAKGIIELM